MRFALGQHNKGVFFLYFCLLVCLSVCLCSFVYLFLIYAILLFKWWAIIDRLLMALMVSDHWSLVLFNPPLLDWSLPPLWGGATDAPPPLYNLIIIKGYVHEQMVLTIYTKLQKTTKQISNAYVQNMFSKQLHLTFLRCCQLLF